jgi:hypothetical protein
MSNQDEIDRIQAIRKRQIEARDPTKKEYQSQKRIAKKYKRIRGNDNFFVDGWKSLSKAWKGFLIGGFIGLIINIILPSYVPGISGVLFGIAAIILFMALGMALGGSFDWRDNLRDKLKR